MPKKKGKVNTSAAKTVDTVQARKRQNQIDLVNNTPARRRPAVAKRIIKSNQNKRK